MRLLFIGLKGEFSRKMKIIFSGIERKYKNVGIFLKGRTWRLWSENAEAPAKYQDSERRKM
ncbi:uncharacterized protein G2W53_044306 [Senna tora]|uniref:Uncharacterized protein n=1 Tax=Senna tora TaxID=362788 RepID=A0A834SIZ0_9FABA|nr:uncharacterized protein G2W53_044306 [Senna tora]